MERRLAILAELHDLTSYINGQVPHNFFSAAGFISDYQRPLSTEEYSYIQNVKLARRREFTAGRIIAKDILYQLKQSNNIILRDKDGCPIWPDQILGSISHKESICCAMAGQNLGYRSLGVDLEKIEDLPKGVWSAFSDMHEISQSTSLGINAGVFANMLFSAKESLFKCLFPIFGQETPSISGINVTVKPNNNQYSIESLHRDAICIGGIAVGHRYLMSWAYVLRDDSGAIHYPVCLK